MHAMNKLNGWTCYPEAAEFDILAVHDYGRQISVEVKLKLYAKVVEQILPQEQDAQLPEGSCGCGLVRGRSGLRYQRNRPVVLRQFCAGFAQAQKSRSKGPA